MVLSNPALLTSTGPSNPSLPADPAPIARKRAASPSASSPSAPKRLKAGPSHPTAGNGNVKRDIKPKPKSKIYSPSVTSISRNWLLHSDPAKLEALLLDACRLYPAFDQKVAASIEENNEMLRGLGEILEFDILVATIEVRLEHYDEGENWITIVEDINGIAEQIGSYHPLRSKLNALEALVSAIGYVPLCLPLLIPLPRRKLSV